MEFGLKSVHISLNDKSSCMNTGRDLQASVVEPKSKY